jgi:hypothetical protein
MGGRLDDARQIAALPSLGDIGARFRATGMAASCALVGAVALRALAGDE